MADHAIPTNDFPVGLIVSERRHTPFYFMAAVMRSSASSSIHAIWHTACTDPNCLCYNSFHGAGTAALGWCSPVAHFWTAIWLGVHGVH